jgi:hypothetical protein
MKGSMARDGKWPIWFTGHRRTDFACRLFDIICRLILSSPFESIEPAHPPG